MAFADACVIWIDPKNGIFVLVSYEDYQWAQQWKWHSTPNSTKKKLYATRCTCLPNSRKQVKIYLHKEILKRTGLKPRSKEHTIGDHRNGDSLDCQRHNLRWATHSMNSRNRKKGAGKPEFQAPQDIPF